MDVRLCLSEIISHKNELVKIFILALREKLKLQSSFYFSFWITFEYNVELNASRSD